MKLVSQMKSFGRPFWAANVMEIFERLAYYGVRVVIPIYIASSEEPGGLHFTNADKGVILMVWALVQTLLPMFTGGYADRYGRKLTIAVSIGIKICGYLLMATQRTYVGFLIACIVLATGTAVFKPGVWGTLARGTNDENASVGWGIFYEVVNIGGVLGPPLAGALHHLAWKWVFFACAGIVSLNFLMLLTYTDHDDAPAPAETRASPVRVFLDSVAKIFAPKLIAFILIMSGFWVMFMQLFDALPNFIEEWTDSSSLVATLGLHEGMLAQMTPRGLQIPQEWMINLDAAAIVLFMIPISALSGKMPRLVAIVVGMFVACAALFVCGRTMNGTLCILAILAFSVGEMIASPRMYEYFSAIAPKGEEALYMGYANVPTAIGWASGVWVAGLVYDRLADRANLATRYLREHALMTGAQLDALKRTDALTALESALHLDARAATQLLWDTYAPYRFWYPWVGIGLASAIGMILFARAASLSTTT